MPDPTVRLVPSRGTDHLADPTITMVLLQLEVNGVPHHLVFHEVAVDEYGNLTHLLSDAGHQVEVQMDLFENDTPWVVEAAGRHWVVYAGRPLWPALRVADRVCPPSLLPDGDEVGGLAGMAGHAATSTQGAAISTAATRRGRRPVDPRVAPLGVEWPPLPPPH